MTDGHGDRRGDTDASKKCRIDQLHCKVDRLYRRNGRNNSVQLSSQIIGTVNASRIRLFDSRYS